MADLYARFRPGYADSAISFIMEHCRLNAGKTLADVGCGTGISSRALAAQGLTVIGIEPNFDMLEAARQANDPEAGIQITYKEGTAEATGLSSGAVDAVLCAQAFHWFNKDTAFAEFHRILNKDGWLILVWNERDESDVFTAQYGKLLRTLPDTSAVEVPRGGAGEPLLYCPLYVEASKKYFPNEQCMDREGFLGRAFSTSYTPKKESAEGRLFQQSLEQLFDEYEQAGTVTMQYKTSVYSAKKAP